MLKPRECVAATPACLRLLPLLALTLCVLNSTAVAEGSEGTRVEVIVINGVPTRGWVILPATETEFKFKLADTDEPITLNWSSVDDSDRKRVQKLYGLEIVDDKKVFGRKCKGVVMRLENGTIRGLRLPDRDRGGEKAIRCASQPLQMIPIRDIKSEEEVDCYESEFFSEREIYERMLLENPPGNNDAAAHLKYATETANMGLYKEALDHLTKAEIIDERTKERNKEMRMQLIADAARKEGEKLFTLLIRHVVAKDYFAALDVFEKFNRNFFNHELKSRVDQMKSEIEEGVKLGKNKRVVELSYRIASDLVQQRFFKKVKIDGKGNKVDAIPGKMVTTRKNHIFRGTLIDPDRDGRLIMLVGDTELSINMKDVASIQDVDLSQGVREVNAGYDELRKYVEDTGSPTGLKSEMVARIATLLNIPQNDVRGIFDNRLEKTASYDNGDMVASKTFVTTHDASFGRGSWLRTGSRPTAWVQLGNQGNQPIRRDPNTGILRAISNQPDPDVNPDATDDPAEWWKFQNSETQLAILRALMAEKVFRVINEQKPSCPNCGGGGTIPVVAPGGQTVAQRCPMCRGIGNLWKIMYR
jgi:tetratricopeptide (TPR) repeat protein